MNPERGPRGIGACHRKAAWAADPRTGASIQRPTVQVRLSAEGRASFGHILRCGSPHVCPSCALTLAQRRADELEYLAARHLAAGGGAYTVALTVRHELRHELRPFLRGISAAWRRCKQGRAWQAFRGIYGIVGDIRALETTVGPRNGWHPHLHLLILTSSPGNDATAAELEEWLYERWRRELEREGLPAPERWAWLEDGTRKGLGAHVAPLRGADGASYIARTNLASAAADVASLTGKEARGDNRTIWQLLQAAAAGDVRAARLWCEWAEASKGMRALTWSCRALREAYGLTAAALEDAELLAVEDAEGEPDVIAEIPAQLYETHVKQPQGWRWAVMVLTIAEAEGGFGVMEFVERCVRGWKKRKPPPWWRQEWGPDGTAAA